MKKKTFRIILQFAVIGSLVFLSGCLAALERLGKMSVRSSNQVMSTTTITDTSDIADGEYETLESNAGLVQITFHKSADFNPVLSPDGKRLLFVSQKHGNNAIFVADNLVKNPQQVTVDASADSHPSWATDGKAILFDSDRLGYTAIFKIELTRTNIVRQIIARGANDSAPAISPNGKLLAFGSGGTASLWLADADGTDLVQIGQGGFPKWSPDGKTILFTSSKSGNADIWSIKPDDSEVRQLTVDAADDVEPCWSPDGKKIVFASNRSGNFDLRVLYLETGEYKQLTNHPANDGGPEWSPDGKFIYFHSTRSGNVDIWRLTPSED